MAAAEAVSPNFFRMGRVVQRTFDTIGRNAALFFGLSALFNLPILFMQWGVLSSAVAAQQGAFNGTALAMTGLGLLVFIFCYAILEAAIIHGTFADLSGRKARFGDCVATGIRAFPAMIAISVLYTLGVAVGLVLLLIPGLIWAVMWAVVFPVRVVEHTGLGESFGRSRVLTKGHRWAIVGLVLIASVLNAVIGGVITISTGGGDVAAAPAPTSTALLVQALGTYVYAIISGVIGTAGLASLYYELRVAKDGIGAEQLAAVFD
jgi:hypothetical protein